MGIIINSNMTWVGLYWEQKTWFVKPVLGSKEFGTWVGTKTLKVLFSWVGNQMKLIWFGLVGIIVSVIALFINWVGIFYDFQNSLN